MIRPKADGSWTAECALCGNGARYANEAEAVDALDEHLSNAHALDSDWDHPEAEEAQR